jgi:hypothetical protein
VGSLAYELDLSYEIADSSGGSGETPFKGVHFCNFSIGEQA